MNLEYRSLLDQDFDKDSKVWIYQANRLFSMGEALEIERMLNDFTDGWMSHGSPVKGAAYLFFGQFIVLMADETATGVGGCSTDSSVRFMKEIENRFGVSLFDRLSLAFVVQEKIQVIPFSQVQYAMENGFINKETLYFNNLVKNKRELETEWIIPVGQSWIAGRHAV